MLTSCFSSFKLLTKGSRNVQLEELCQKLVFFLGRGSSPLTDNHHQARNKKDEKDEESLKDN